MSSQTEALSSQNRRRSGRSSCWMMRCRVTAVRWFWVVYVPLGLNPISLKLFTNYALELAPSTAEHPRYVSIVGAALAAPFVLSPLVGLAVDRLGFRGVFVAGAVVILAGAVVAARLPEPRHCRRGE